MLDIDDYVLRQLAEHDISAKALREIDINLAK